MQQRYVVTSSHNAESQNRRGLLRDYAVTRGSQAHVCTQGCAWVCVQACVCEVHVNA